MINTLFLKDMSKPEGEACNPDGMLKDAEQIEWLNSPLDLNQDKCTLHDEYDDDHITERHQVC